MLLPLRQLLSLLGPREKRAGAFLLVMIVIGAMVEVVGVAAVPAFISAIINPETLLKFEMLREPLGLDALVAWLKARDKTDVVLAGSALLILVFALKTAFLMLNFYLQVRFISARRVDIATRLARCYLHAPYTFHLERNTSVLLRNVDREAGIIAYSVIGPLLEVCTRFVILIAVLAFLFVAEPVVTLYWIALFGVLGYAGTAIVGRKLKEHGQAEQAERKTFLQALHQAFGTVKEARVLNREQYFEETVGSSVRAITAAMQFKLFSGKVISPVTELVAVAGLLTLASGLLLAGRTTESIVVTLSLFVVGLVRLRETLNASLFQLTNLRYNLVSITPVFEDLSALEAEVTRRDGLRRCPDAPRRVLNDAVELRDVWHSYGENDQYSLTSIDLRIPRGASVGIVGSTGAGKSTLVDVILGLIRPARGHVLVDGRDIHDPDPGAWQRTIGYVPQAIYLLDDTIRRNIALGIRDDEIDETALWRAIRQAQLEGFIQRQPQGLDTVIGERGARISGGERQRIGIARALYHDPEVLVLDEATSALDNETERAVVEAVRASQGRRTIIMIAHRLSTVRDCSKLYFLKRGRIEAEGSFDELVARNEEFRAMALPQDGAEASA